MREYQHIWAIIRRLILLSHGQATVERGFSVNRQIEVENLQEQSVIAQRIIHDHIISVGGVMNVDMSKSLLLSAGSARQKYMAYLDDQQQRKLKESCLKKRKDLMEAQDSC